MNDIFSYIKLESEICAAQSYLAGSNGQPGKTRQSLVELRALIRNKTIDLLKLLHGAAKTIRSWLFRFDKFPYFRSALNFFISSRLLSFLRNILHKALLPQLPDGTITYNQWLKLYGASQDIRGEAIRRDILANFKTHPLISLVIPVYNTRSGVLRETLNSIVFQHYTNWKIYIADDCSTSEDTLSVLAEYKSRLGDRLHIIHLPQNGHISRATNEALALVDGEFFGLLDHDDTLTKDALYWVVKTIAANPDVALIYTDEDKVSADSSRYYDPYFKPDWSYELFKSQNYLAHFAVYRTELARRIGGFRVGFEGAQDWDFAMRYIEQINLQNIVHIPRILYHWRASCGSTALNVGEKKYAMAAGFKVLVEHLKRTGQAGEVEDKNSSIFPYFRIKYKIPADKEPLVSIIIPTKNKKKLLEGCIQSIKTRTSYKNYEIIIVNNGSDELETITYLRMLEQESRILLLHDIEPFNFPRLNNKAALAANGEYLLLLNNDVEVITPDWLDEMLSHAILAGVGAVGAKLLYPDNTIQHAGIILVGGVAGHAHKHLDKTRAGHFGRALVTQNFVAVTGACLLISKKIYFEVGGMDENLAVAFNDVDLCLKIFAAGYRNVWTPFAQLYHYESKSRGYEDTPEKQNRFQAEANLMRQRWRSLLENDPYLNPNLSNQHETFLIAENPRVIY